jgi:hypothetical protein
VGGWTLPACLLGRTACLLGGTAWLLLVYIRNIKNTKNIPYISKYTKKYFGSTTNEAPTGRLVRIQNITMSCYIRNISTTTQKYSEMLWLSSEIF